MLKRLPKKKAQNNFVKESAYSIFAVCLFAMVILCTDLDNTMIYSHKHDIGEEKLCVEIYNNREISFITENTRKLLNEVRRRMLVVPVTTRTMEQYNRINLGVGEFEYALTCNGGILLRNGKSDENWYSESLNMVKDSSAEIKRAIEILKRDENVSFEIRFISDLFVFTKSDMPYETIKRLSAELDVEKVDIFDNGSKVYVVPKELNKGNAVKRLKRLIEHSVIIAAGDSNFDISMLKAADYVIYPKELNIENIGAKGTVCEAEELLSEKTLRTALEIYENLKYNNR